MSVSCPCSTSKGVLVPVNSQEDLTFVTRKSIVCFTDIPGYLCQNCGKFYYHGELIKQIEELCKDDQYLDLPDSVSLKDWPQIRDLNAILSR